MTSFHLVTRRSARGYVYHVLEPLVPRISDSFLDCVIYLYGSEVEADDGARAGGSGFLVGVPSQGLPQNFWFLYAVTNKHVIVNSTVVRLNTKDGKKDIMPTTRSAWQIHPAGDDLAACLISFDPANYKFNHVPRSILLSRENVKALNVGPGDDVFVVGRFINHEGRQMNLPTARFGNIGQMPWEPIKQDDGFEQESFLVEARSIGGYSGSPVFWHILPFAAGMGRRNIEYHAGPYLLGIDWGHLNNWEPVRNEHEQPVNPDPKKCRSG